MLVVSENVRIRKNDPYNYVIEVYRKVENPRTKDVTSRWVLEGYYSSIRQALQRIERKELLVDEEVATTLADYLKQIEESHQILHEAIEKIKRDGEVLGNVE